MWKRGCIQKQWIIPFISHTLSRQDQVSATGSNHKPRYLFQTLQLTLTPAKGKTHLKYAKKSFFKILSCKSPCILPTPPSSFCFHFNLSNCLLSLKPPYSFFFFFFFLMLQVKKSLLSRLWKILIKKWDFLQLPTHPSTMVLLACLYSQYFSGCSRQNALLFVVNYILLLCQQNILLSLFSALATTSIQISPKLGLWFCILLFPVPFGKPLWLIFVCYSLFWSPSPKQHYATIARVHVRIVCNVHWKGNYRWIRKEIKIVGIKSRYLSLQFRTLYPGNWRLTFNSSLQLANHLQTKDPCGDPNVVWSFF